METNYKQVHAENDENRNMNMKREYEGKQTGDRAKTQTTAKLHNNKMSRVQRTRAGNREQGVGSREQGAGNRKQEAWEAHRMIWQ